MIGQKRKLDREPPGSAWLRAGLLAFLLALGAVTVGCGEDDKDSDGDHDDEGLRMCCELGEICHMVDDGDGPLSACHDIGHKNEPEGCRKNYDRCITACEKAGADITPPASCEMPDDDHD